MTKLLLPLVLLVASPAYAHTGAGHVDSLASGFSHPFLGADHLLAMVLVGVWASLIGGQRMWIWPLSFLLAMVAGGLFGFAGYMFPGMEIAIAGSVIVLGLVVVGALALPVTLGSALIALFGVAHGIAHGAEAAGAGFVPYAVGFLLASALLHGAGLLAASRLSAAIVRALGGTVAVAGLAMVLA